MFYNQVRCCRAVPLSPLSSRMLSIVVDAGIGRFIKYRMSLALDDCLEAPDFLEKWEHGKFTARERRVCLDH